MKKLLVTDPKYSRLLSASKGSYSSQISQYWSNTMGESILSAFHQTKKAAKLYHLCQDLSCHGSYVSFHSADLPMTLRLGLRHPSTEIMCSPLLPQLPAFFSRPSHLTADTAHSKRKRQSVTHPDGPSQFMQMVEHWLSTYTSCVDTHKAQSRMRGLQRQDSESLHYSHCVRNESHELGR